MEGAVRAVATYQALLQQSVRLLSLGYHWHSLTMRPVRKENNAEDIDRKLVERYPVLALNKFQRARRKQKGLLNAQMVRFQRWQILFRSDGADDCGLVAGETWTDIRRERLVISELWRGFSFVVVRVDGSVTVALHKPNWQGVRAWFAELAKARVPIAVIQAQFRQLDRDLPAWHGLYRQKKALAKLVVASLRKAGTRCQMSDFPVSSFRRPVKLYELPAPRQDS